MWEYTIKMNERDDCNNFNIMEQGRFCRHGDELGVPENGSIYLALETTVGPTCAVSSVNLVFWLGVIWATL
jgi:hypothetical protein